MWEKLNSCYFVNSSCAFYYRASYASAVYAVIVCLSVRPSVSHKSKLSMMAKSRMKQTTLYDSPGTLVFCCQNSWRHSNEITPNRGAKQRWGRFEAALFDQYLAISQKRSKTGTYFLWKANRNSYPLYRMTLFSMIFGDPKPPRFQHFATRFIFP